MKDNDDDCIILGYDVEKDMYFCKFVLQCHMRTCRFLVEWKTCNTELYNRSMKKTK